MRDRMERDFTSLEERVFQDTSKGQHPEDMQKLEQKYGSSAARNMSRIILWLVVMGLFFLAIAFCVWALDIVSDTITKLFNP